MKETLKKLRAHHQPVPVPLELPDEDRLVEVEEELLVSIPLDLRQFLLHGSDVVYGSLEPVTAADPFSHTYLPEVAAQAWDVGMPRDLLPVCEIDGGYYCINPDGEVALWLDGELTEGTWSDFWQWVREVWLYS
ncbi:SMI1/KNR4 family protein [Marinimicrobium sp. ABcell2]|uniref:SMI1/KNR4 family protein n=1 Tax=Marinimicrobium sp. ABcell2 TaxID=3069751 RepID=UPI0027B5D5E4|nr:SMI1/KNR4 family protein [Marinimicrobium sp. ABcell2]MDQ2078221.1 SMI1/KNR4 family protein [Marinimicrobium sp. ABcell2]